MFSTLIADVSAPAPGGAADTGILDVSLFDSLHVIIARNLATGWAGMSVGSIDEAGGFAPLLIGVVPTDDNPTQFSQVSFCWGKGLVVNQAINLPLPRRVQYILGSVGGQIARIMIYGCREGK